MNQLGKMSAETEFDDNTVLTSVGLAALSDEQMFAMKDYWM